MGVSSVYLKMRVLGAVDSAPGRTKNERLHYVAGMTFVDEQGIPRSFTWRTIQTWLWNYLNTGMTSLRNKERADKGKLRKVSPEQLYVDNGAIYTCKEIMLTCARLGILLSHAPVRDGAAKGKIERFFRNVRESFLTRKLDLSSLDSLNRQFTAWVEDEYNCCVHSTIQMKPIDRFGLDLKRIKFLAISEATDEIFFVEESRSVKADNTFPLKNIRFETPADLANRQIQVRFDRKHFDHNKVIVYYKQQRIGYARPVDFVANDRPSPRLRPTSTPPRPSTCTTESNENTNN